MDSDTPASPPTPHAQPSPLDALLLSAAERCDDPAVKQWLQALLDGERADSATTVQPPAERSPD